MTLARALYSSAKTLLLDDVLAALDVHTGRWIVEQVFKGPLVKDRTILLITHNVLFMSSVAEHVVALGRGGRVTSQGSLDEALSRDASLRAEVQRGQTQAEQEGSIVETIDPATDTDDVKKVTGESSEEEDTRKKNAGKLTVAEEKALGNVELEAIMIFIKAMGGWVVWGSILTFRFLRVFSYILQTWYVGEWAMQYTLRPKEEVYAPK